MVNRETPRPGLRVALLGRRGAANGDGRGECLSSTRATLCHGRSRMALLGGWTRGSGEGRGMLDLLSFWTLLGRFQK